MEAANSLPLGTLTLAAGRTASVVAAPPRRVAVRPGVATDSSVVCHVPQPAQPSASTSGSGAVAAAGVALQPPACRRRSWNAAKQALPLVKGLVLAGVVRALVVKVVQPAMAHARPLRRAGGLLAHLVPGRIANTPADRPGVPGARKPALVWFRQDLRLHDHAPLAAANQAATSVLPVYCFDPREYGKAPSGFDKTGPYRARFLVEALHDLRTRLRDAGSDLIVRVGKPEDVLPKLAQQLGAGTVHCHSEVTPEEQGVEGAVARALDRCGCRLVRHWGGTLLQLDDLPFKVDAMPRNYGDFRSKVASLAPRSPVERPAEIKGLPAGSPEPGDIPSLQRLGFSAATLAKCAANKAAQGAAARGGETEGLRQLQAFAQHLVHSMRGGASSSSSSSSGAHGGTTAGGGHRASAATAATFSCKISPWLALGCLSPRHLYQQLQREAGAAGKQDGLSWLQFELLWRDFFKFVNASYTAAGVRTGAPAMA